MNLKKSKNYNSNTKLTKKKYLISFKKYDNLTINIQFKI